MSKVLVIGSQGVIGGVLQQYLSHDITDFDLPEHNAEHVDQLIKKAVGHDVIVHLAWDFERDGWLAENLNPNNTLISFNVYQAAMDAGVKRVIMASSVHADKFAQLSPGSDILHPYTLPLPDSPYGAGKVMMEALGRYYADAKGLEVVCIRFGGVNRADVPPDSPPSERDVWLSHRDCAGLVQAAIDAPSIPGGYSIVYGISNNAGRRHDTINPFGWMPLDGAA